MGIAALEIEKKIEVNGRRYHWPQRPSVVVCFDGCDPEYIDAASHSGVIPTIDRIIETGFSAVADAAMPTFTNPNNISIVCGASPAVHGVSGNFYFDRTTRQDIMMVDDTPLRASTILAEFSQAGAGVAAITAKDKLRKALGRGLDGINFSAQKAGNCTFDENGILGVTDLVGRGAPDQYSADLSLYVLDAGIELLKTRPLDIVYLSLSDYVQHKNAPGTDEANAFMAAVDRRLAALIDLGAVVGIVADHGMHDMASGSGEPNVIYLGDVLDAKFGENVLRVICPITDPFVKHHGALGGFVRVHAKHENTPIEPVAAFLRTLPGVDQALSRQEAASKFNLPEDREGDIAVIAQKGVALGARRIDHDLSQLAGERLRSHGGLAERNVPFLVSEPVSDRFIELRSGTLHNYDIFDFVLNGVKAG